MIPFNPRNSRCASRRGVESPRWLGIIVFVMYDASYLMRRSLIAFIMAMARCGASISRVIRDTGPCVRRDVFSREAFFRAVGCRAWGDFFFFF